VSTDQTPKQVVLSSTKPGLAPVLVDGACVHIECTDWCDGHEGQNAVFLRDVYHRSEQVALRGPSEGDDWLLLADVRADAFGTDTEPRFVVDAGEDIVVMTLAQALKWANDVVAFAEKVRAIAQTALELEGDE